MKIFYVIVFIILPFSLLAQSQKDKLSLLPIYFLNDSKDVDEDLLYETIKKIIVNENNVDIISKDVIMNILKSTSIPKDEVILNKELYLIQKKLNSNLLIYVIVNYDEIGNLSIVSKLIDNSGQRSINQDTIFIRDNVQLESNRSLINHIKKLFSKDNFIETNKRNIKNKNKDSSSDVVFYDKGENTKIAFIPSYNLTYNIDLVNSDRLENQFVDEISKIEELKFQNKNFIREIIRNNKIDTDLVLVDEELREILSKSKSDIVIYTLIYNNKRGNIEFYTKVINKYGKVKILINELNLNLENIALFESESKKIVMLTMDQIIGGIISLPINFTYKYLPDPEVFPKFINFAPFFEYLDGEIKISKDKIKFDKDSTNFESFVKSDNFVSTLLYDDKTIITSSENKAIYLIDTFNGTLQKKLKDEKILNIATPAIFYNDGVLFANEKKLYYFKDVKDNYSKKVIRDRTVFNLDASSGFWAKPLIYNNKVLIPLSNMVLSFDGSKVEPLEIFGLIGQTFLTLDNDFLYILDSFGVKVFKYNLKSNKMEWVSRQIRDITVFSPVTISSNKIFFADIQNRLFMFDTNSEDNSKEVDIRTGVSSNIINVKDKLYFVARDGYFYSYDIKNSVIERVVKVDANPSIDKYLTKKSVRYKDYIIFCTDRGSLFAYDVVSNFYDFVKVVDTNASLLGSPIVNNNTIYLIDVKGNSYKISDFSLLR